MQEPLIVSLLDDPSPGKRLAKELGAELAELELRSFPDGEAYIRIDTPIEGRDVILYAALDYPNTKFLPLMFAAETLSDLQVASIGLVAPYLPYMRQDTRFRPGEGLTSHFFARQVSRNFDWLVTVDPHLHRIQNLDEIYSIPTKVVASARAIASWIGSHVENPLLVGPDEESEQWVEAIAKAGGFPKMILKKDRRGDYDVKVTGGAAPVRSNQQPVLVDDIISTGRTMVDAWRVLQEYDLSNPICIGIHGLFVEDARQVLEEAGLTRVVTTNTVTDATNDIDIFADLVDGVRDLLES